MDVHKLVLRLPANYRPSDILTFYERDPDKVSEFTEGQSIHKGLIWNDQLARLKVSFLSDCAEVILHFDREASISLQEFEEMARRCLGLDQDIESFENSLSTDSPLGSLVARYSGRRVPVTATPFEALAWAIIGQQISVSAAVSIRRRLLQGLALRHSSGLLCFPTAAEIAPLEPEDLIQFGFSRSKASTLKTVCQAVLEGSLPLNRWLKEIPGQAEEIRQALLSLKGIGPWTVDYTLLRGYGWLDGSLHGDVAVRRNLATLLGLAEYPTQEFSKQWLEQYRPWRALAAVHLWGSIVQ